ncbi:MAG: hypothetical protein L6290_07680 [Thermodesulfovibrionales bacterium]|nr:hypothetical protein [Thermodesulfovibrionales bacterium]
MRKKNIPEIEKVACALKKEYKDFDHHNKRNPLDELFFILCSVKRGEKVYLQAFQSLKQEFPRYELLASSSIEKITSAVSWCGLQNQKAAAAKEIIKRLIESFGKPTLAPLKKMSDEECETFLTGLPGIGKKVARCVMLYSLDRQVFPVDSHCWRIARRLGWIKPSGSNGNCSSKGMDRLQEIIPPKLRFSLHVNMLSHGRDVCKEKTPICSFCMISDYCPKIGLNISIMRQISCTRRK